MLCKRLWCDRVIFYAILWEANSKYLSLGKPDVMCWEHDDPSEVNNWCAVAER